MIEPPARSDPETIRLLQWNVWYRADPKAIGEHMLRLTETYGMPDAVCLQEVLEPTRDILADTIDARFVSYVGTRQHRDGRTEGQAIMTPGPLADYMDGADIVVLSRGGRAPFKGGGQSSRVVQTIRTAAAPTIAVANTHTSYRTPFNARVRHMERVALQRMVMGESGLILTGDFNAPTNSPIIRSLSRCLVRAQIAYPTWTSSHFDHVGLLRRDLDHVFATPDMRVSVASLPAGPSDHTPLLITATQI